jgi:hypothetical protein
VCVVGANLPQTMALVVLSADGKNEDKEQLTSSLVETVTEINKTLDKHEKHQKSSSDARRMDS